MKCLLCSSQFEERDKLIEHYISYHNINKNNFFFKCLLQNIENKPHLKKCIRCDEFITIKKYKVEHDFLKHYDDGNEIPFEEKPLQIVRNKALFIKLNIVNIMKNMIFIMQKNVSMIFFLMLNINIKLRVKNGLNVPSL